VSTGPFVTIVAAMIGSAPGWVGLYLSNRRSLRKQTEDIKRHVTETAQKEKT
jgi:hypothetical protein